MPLPIKRRWNLYVGPILKSVGLFFGVVLWLRFLILNVQYSTYNIQCSMKMHRDWV